LLGGLLAYYRILAARGEARLLTTREVMSQHMAQWSATETHDNLPVGMVLGMEGADPILWPEQVHEWWQVGLRVVSLSHYGVSTYSHGTSTHGGLFPIAQPLLREMERCGMILDLTHTDDESFWQALAWFSGPVIASHQNCRALVPGGRQFSDEQLNVLIKRGAVIGTSMDTWMLYPDGNLDWDAHPYPTRRSRFPREAVTLEHVANQIDHVCQLAGNAHHAAIGGDTDGQGGRDGAPFEIDTVADYQKVTAVLERRGYAIEAIANIMHGNWQRFYETWLP
jgi:membrane dipeptidase